MSQRVGRSTAVLLMLAATLMFALVMMQRADKASAADFEIQFNNGQMSLGGLGNIPLGTGSGTVTTFKGTVNGSNVSVPKDNFDLPSFAIDEGMISGSVGLLANGNGTGSYNAATGQFNLNTSLALNFTVNNVGEIISMIPVESIPAEYQIFISLLSGLDRLSCSISPLPLNFSTEATTPFQGKRFADGFEGSGAVAASWTQTPTIKGGTGNFLEQIAFNLICPLIAQTAGLDVPETEGSILLSREVAGPTPEYTLTTNMSGDGSGQVSTSPQPVGGTYTEGTAVTLTATPDEGSEFAGWSGGSCAPLVNPCVLTMDGNRTATAEFNLIPVEPEPSFDLVVTGGIASFGNEIDVPAAVNSGEAASFTGDWDENTNDLIIPAGTAILPSFEGDFGSISFESSGSHLAGTSTPNGKVTIQGPVRVNLSLAGDDGDLTCQSSTRIQLRTDQRALYNGLRFRDGLGQNGALAAHWDSLPNVRGDAGCAAAAAGLSGSGGMLLSR